MTNHTATTDRRGPLFAGIAALLTGMAAGMGWGIRGQYGHETGAMIAGVLAALTLVMLFVPRANSLRAARAAAMMAVAIGIGGSMTYGQTVGLTHDQELIGNYEALVWGLLGLFVKGAVWIGFGGALLGMGLGGIRYRAGEIALLFPALLAISFVGIWLVNTPYDPATKSLPWIYFSDDWYFEPGRDLKPRRETWGGLWLALICLVIYVRCIRRDRLALRMAVVGVLAGGIGFPTGQCVQAFRAWNPQVFSEGFLSRFADITSYFNWWNMMETTFGFVFGFVLALGLYANRKLIAIGCDRDSSDQTMNGSQDRLNGDQSTPISPAWEIVLLVVHVVLLITSEFLEFASNADGSPFWASYIEFYTEYGLLMSTIPLIGILGGRMCPFLMLLPVVAIPIVGKTVRQMCYQTTDLDVGAGWLLLVTIPLGILTVVASLLIEHRQSMKTYAFAAVGLIVTSSIYFGLNTIFFRGAWPWAEEWTGRTPNQTINLLCVTSLVIASIVSAIYWSLLGVSTSQVRADR